MGEIFKPIKGYEDYLIGNNGTILSNKYKKTRTLKPFLDSQGRYYMIILCKDNVKTKKLIHRLVCEAFVDNPNNYNVVNHLDHDSHNNSYTNLEWTTTQLNVHHSYSTMPPDRNKRQCVLIYPNGTRQTFNSYEDVKRHRDQYNLPFSKSSLERNLHSKGFQLIKL